MREINEKLIPSGWSFNFHKPWRSLGISTDGHQRETCEDGGGGDGNAGDEPSSQLKHRHTHTYKLNKWREKESPTRLPTSPLPLQSHFHPSLSVKRHRSQAAKLYLVWPRSILSALLVFLPASLLKQTAEGVSLPACWPANGCLHPVWNPPTSSTFCYTTTSLWVFFYLRYNYLNPPSKPSNVLVRLSVDIDIGTKNQYQYQIPWFRLNSNKPQDFFTHLAVLKPIFHFIYIINLMWWDICHKHWRRDELWRSMSNLF